MKGTRETRRARLDHSSARQLVTQLARAIGKGNAMRHEKPQPTPPPMQPRAAGLTCLVCMNRKPEQEFRIDRRANKRNHRAYSCLDCDRAARDARTADTKPAPATVPAPNSDRSNAAAPARGNRD